MKRSAWRRIFRNCHHLRKMRYQDTGEKTTRTPSTNFVSRLEVRTSSQGVVGTARPTCSNTRQPSFEKPNRSVRIPGRVRPVPSPGAGDDLLQPGAPGAPAQQLLGPARGGDERRWVSGPPRARYRPDRPAGDAARGLRHREHGVARSGSEVDRLGARDVGLEGLDVRVG